MHLITLFLSFACLFVQNIPSSTHTVHGSHSSNPENITHTSYYSPNESNPSPNVPNPVDSYQHVWDPWEEYDSRQISDPIPEQTSEIFHSQDTSFESQHVPQNVTSYDETHTYHVDNTIYTPHIETHIHQDHHDNVRDSNHHEHHFQVQGHESYSEHHDPPQFHHVEQNNHVESHNANAHLESHHDHCIDPPHHTNSQSNAQIIVHSEPPNVPIQTSKDIKPPPPSPIPFEPRLSNECVGTTTVSNETNLCSSEDRHEDDVSILVDLSEEHIK